MIHSIQEDESLSGAEDSSGARPRVITIVGPNAGGKSDLGIRLASEYGGEIISADSRQVFRGMDIGTGKVEGPTLPESGRNVEILGRRFFLAPRISGGIAHWLLDIVAPREGFNAAEYQQLAYDCIRDIVLRDRLPIIVGGTGLYIRAVLDGLSFPSVTPSGELRRELEQKTVDELRAMILAHDSEAGKVVDLTNRRRMVRALEVALCTGEPLSIMRKRSPVFFDALTIGILIPREQLNERIRERLRRRLETGMISEVERLMKMGVSPERLESFGLEYRFIYRHLAGRLNLQEMTEALYREICRFAKRQMTWFRKYGNVQWLSNYEEAKELVEGFLV